MKSGFVAILGRPNVGKSTIMNRLIGYKIAAVSSRAQTTRHKIQTVYTDDRGQIILLDTPGVNKAETKLGEYMLDAAVDSLKTADVIMWVIEPSTFIGKGERLIAETIGKAAGGKSSRPVCLVINKVDTVSDNTSDILMRTKDTYSRYMKQEYGVTFRDIYEVSAAKNTGVKELMSGLFELLPEGPLYYDPDTLTDETERDIAAEFIREKCLMYLDKEIPHGIAVIVDSMKFRERRGATGDGPVVFGNAAEPGDDSKTLSDSSDTYDDINENEIADIEATIICEKESHKGIIIGKKGVMLKKIGSAARHDIEEMLGCRVNLRLWVKVRPGWRNNFGNLKEYGYSEKK